MVFVGPDLVSGQLDGNRSGASGGHALPRIGGLWPGPVFLEVAAVVFAVEADRVSVKRPLSLRRAGSYGSATSTDTDVTWAGSVGMQFKITKLLDIEVGCRYLRLTGSTY